jgi:hypothetical protein
LEKENNLLRSALDEMLNKYLKIIMNTDHSTNSSGKLLSRMMKQASSQVRKNSNGRQYGDEVLRKFAMNLWIVGGRRCYAILQSNLLGVFPSSQNVIREMAKYKLPVVDCTHFFNES